MTTKSSGSPPLGAPARIPALPGLGTTWYERGARYWLRRVSGAVLWFAVLAFACYIALALYQSFRGDLPSDVRRVGDWAQVVVSCVALVLAAFTVREYPSEVGARRVLEG
ncbi:hypothetical protein ACFY1B_20475 [Streptomyces mirabilis]|uniref:hypothetical protein n=1 Tax=Streptomyces mirabilis TaxID=68239 RepID=UPI00368D9F3A